jgi:hypothetical protein
VAGREIVEREIRVQLIESVPISSHDPAFPITIHYRNIAKR